MNLLDAMELSLVCQATEATMAVETPDNSMALSGYAQGTHCGYSILVSNPNPSQANGGGSRREEKFSSKDKKEADDINQCLECYLTGSACKHMAPADTELTSQEKKDALLEGETGNKTKASSVYVIKTTKEERKKGKKMYNCSSCGHPGNSTSNIYKHMRNHHPFRIIERLNGTICSNTERKRKIIASPVVRMSAVNDQVVKIVKAKKEDIAKGAKLYQCTVCGKSSNSTSNLYRHMKSLHKGYRIERINKLDAVIPRGQRLEVNALLTPTSNKVVKIVKSSDEEVARGEKQYKCSECGKGGDCTGNLYAHMDVAHPDCAVQHVKPSSQGKMPSTPTDSNCEKVVKVLTATHKGKMVYKCSECCMVTSCTSNLYKHMRRQHKGLVILKRLQKRRKVMREDKGLNISQKLARHVGDDNRIDRCYRDAQSYHHQFQSNAVESYECSVCMETFTKCSDLDSHVKSHEGEDSNQSFPSHIIDFDVDENAIRNNVEDIEEICEEILEEDEETGSVEEDDSSGSSNGRKIGSEIKENRPSVVSGKKSILNHSYNTNIANNTLRKEASHLVDGNGSVEIQDHLPLTLPNGSYHSTQLSSKTVTVIRTSLEERRNGGKMYRCSHCDKRSNFTSNLYRHMQKFHKNFQIKSLAKDSAKSKTGQKVQDGTPRSFLSNVSHVEGEENVTRGNFKDRDGEETEEVENVLNRSFEEDCESGRDVGLVVNELSRGRRSVVSQSKSFLSHSHNTTRKETSLIVSEDIETADYNPLILSCPSVNDTQSVTVIRTSLEERENGGKKYRCSHCDKRSNFTSNLYRHMKRCHQNFEIKNLSEESFYSEGQEDATPNVRSCDREISNYDNTKSRGNSNSGNEEKTVRVIAVPKTELKNGDKRYRCSECGHMNDSTSNLYKHMKQSHQGYIIQKIKHRGVVGTTRQENEDIVKILRISQSMYRCSKCEFESSFRESVYNHVRDHHKGCVIERGKEEVTLSPLAPGETVKTVGVVRTPLTERSKGKKMYECSRCPYSNDSTSNLYKHMRSCHVDCVITKLKSINRYYDLCDYNVSVDSNVVRVIRLPSQGRPLYKCSKCDRTSNNTSNLYKHMSRCHPEFVILKKIRDNEYLRRLRSQNLHSDIDDVADEEEEEDSDEEEEEIVDNPEGDRTVLNFGAYECSVCMEVFSSCQDLDAHTTSTVCDSPVIL